MWTSPLSMDRLVPGSIIRPHPVRLSFPDGTTSRTIIVGINDDTEVQGSRSFTLNLSNATGGATVSDPSTGLGDHR